MSERIKYLFMIVCFGVEVLIDIGLKLSIERICCFELLYNTSHMCVSESNTIYFILLVEVFINIGL